MCRATGYGPYTYTYRAHETRDERLDLIRAISDQTRPRPRDVPCASVTEENEREKKESRISSLIIELVD